MKNYTITVNGVAYNVTVEENGAAPAAPSASVSAPVTAAPVSAPAASGSIKVEAPMPGTIIDVKVSTGNAVQTGDTLLVLEAMKMENNIVAPSDGTVAGVNVNKGDTVDAGQILITLN